ncbi:MAG: polysaccharide deacetylase family protein [Bryobacteraceae bacterium]
MQSLISLTFDDGLLCQFEKAIPILNDYGIPATFFLTANQDSTHESWNHKNDWRKIDWSEGDIANLKKLINDGHEIGSHGVTHCLQRMQANPQAEAHESKELIEGWLGTRVTSFCYPFYSSHEYLGDAVKNAGFEQARGGARGSYYAVSGDPTFDRFNVDCRQISANDEVSDWLQPGCWRVLTFHAIGSQPDGWAPISVEKFATLMAELAKHRDEGAVEVLTFKCGAARLQ